jgi:DNA-binding NarL/FixJ family response regulator
MRADRVAIAGRRCQTGLVESSVPIRVIYVEDDPLLADMLAERLREDPRVAEVLAYRAPGAVAEDPAAVRGADVALLDLALGAGVPSGIDLGLTLRAMHRDLPIVILSQHRVPRVDDVVPPRERHGWSFIQKGSGTGAEAVVDALVSAVAGRTLIDATWDTQPAADVLARLTPRQREVMTLAAAGYDARAISQQLHLSHVSIRRELSHAYRVLVPDAPAGTDLRTAAVLAYLRLSPGAEPVPS